MSALAWDRALQDLRGHLGEEQEASGRVFHIALAPRSNYNLEARAGARRGRGERVSRSRAAPRVETTLSRQR